MLTPAERDERLKQLSEIDLLEILDISSEDIVDRFPDKIEEREPYYLEDLDDDEQDE
jgi:hypothetical protein